jgi:hypothetical protein
MHNFLPLLFLAAALTVRQDHAPLRAGCETDDDAVAELKSGTPLEIRYARSGSLGRCYKVNASLDGKPVEGYLTEGAISGLETFEQGLRNAPTVTEDRPPAVSVSPRDGTDQQLPAIVRDYNALVGAGLAAYKNDDANNALDYLRQAEKVHQDRSVELLIARLEKEVAGDKSTDKLVSSRFMLRYEAGDISSDIAHSMISFLDQEYTRVANQLGCSSTDRLVTIVQTEKAYRASSDAAEWNGGQYDGRIRLPLFDLKTVTPQTRQTIAHELVHACLANLGQWPAWLHEGLAMKISGQTIPAQYRTKTKADLHAGKMPRLENMSQSWTRLDAEHAATAYAYSFMAVELMLDHYQATGIQNILRSPERFPIITAELDRLLAE